MPASRAATTTEISGRVFSTTEEASTFLTDFTGGTVDSSMSEFAPHILLSFFSCSSMLFHLICWTWCPPYTQLLLEKNPKYSVTVRLLLSFLSFCPTTAFVYYCAPSSILSLPSPIPSLLLSPACFFLPYSGVPCALFLLALLASVSLFQSSSTLPALGFS